MLSPALLEKEQKQIVTLFRRMSEAAEVHFVIYVFVMF